MPSFPGFRRFSRESQPIDRNNIHINQDGDAEGFHRTPSKRDFFRKILRRSSMRSDSPVDKLQKQGLVNLDEKEEPSAHPVRKPSSPDPNKPLPPPPPVVNLEEPSKSEPLAKPAVKLDRIIAPLAAADLHVLFSGAPQFYASSEGHGTGAPQPSVSFPFNPELKSKGLLDHYQIQDEAWLSVTACPHVARRSKETDPTATESDLENQWAHFSPQCYERPNMLSMQGLEKGTVGYQAALEMGVADALQTSQDNSYNSVPTSANRKRFLQSKNGLRPLADAALIERLMTISGIYHADINQPIRSTIELYTDLFTQVLYPPTRVTDSDDPYSLHVQIEMLVQVLEAKQVWIDFSLVEWRIKLGFLLWGSRSEPEIETQVAANDEKPDDLNTPRYWLLLQILLSCELLIRLDAAVKNFPSGKDDVKSDEVTHFEKTATAGVRWSIILARRWLENIRIEPPKSISSSEQKTSAGWLASFTGSHQPETVSNILMDCRFEGRHQTRQLSGLVHFVQKLKWPNVDTIVTKVSSNGINMSESSFSTPAGTPRSVLTNQSNSYFSRRPGIRRGLSVTSRLSAIVNPSGWLSNSYISGLVLPGESLSHLLISTLLENDSVAVAKLGEEANLYGGFVYQDRSFWSTSCVVGRVLAAGSGASECMGWLSSDVVPKGTDEGWVDVEVEDVHDLELDKKRSRPRILRKPTVERSGHIIGGADASSVLPGDFIMPFDEPSQAALSCRLESLDLFAAVDTAPSTPTGASPTPLTDSSFRSTIKTYSAMMRFSFQADGETRREINLSLANDIFFLTAHPCIPSQNIEVLKSPSSPSFQHAEASRGLDNSGHPLHKAFTYTRISLDQLLITSSSTSFDSLLSRPPSPGAGQSTTHTTSSSIPKILVVDCTDLTMSTFPLRRPSKAEGIESLGKAERKAGFGSDLEVLARALCAEKGWNALVSRRGRGCLSCAVREAGSVGWRVVLRFA